MREVTEQYSEVISRLQKVLLENTSILSDKTRSEVYSRFNNVRYFLLNSSDKDYYSTALAYFSVNDRNIYIMDHNYRVAEKNVSKEEESRLLATMPNPFDDVVLLHEMIHSGSCKKDPLTGDWIVGYRLTKENKTLNGYTKTIFQENKGLNEGATEFYAQTFSKRESSNYVFFTQMYRVLSDACGYKNLMEAFFSADIQKFKGIVRKTYHLKDDTLTEKLLRQMDVVFTASNNTHAVLRYLPLIKNCFETLTKMQVNKIREEAKQSSKTPAEFIEKFKREFDKFNISDYIIKDSCFIGRIWLNSIASQIKKNKQALLADYISQKHSSSFLKNTTADIIDSIKCKDASKLCYFKAHLGDDRLDVLRLLNQQITISHVGNRCNTPVVIENYLKVLSDKNKKIDLSDFSQEDKFEFMTIILYSPYEELSKAYKYFNLHDIQDYLNCQEDAYARFIDDLDAMEYIEPIVPNLNDDIKANEDFMSQYQMVKRDKEMEMEL